jgi:hypothetical protein
LGGPVDFFRTRVPDFLEKFLTIKDRDDFTNSKIKIFLSLLHIFDIWNPYICSYTQIEIK